MNSTGTSGHGFGNEVLIDAPATYVWKVFSDVQRWPDWTPSITRVVVDVPGLEIGRVVRIKQPRTPNMVWTVTALTAGRSWTWTTRSMGITTSATHRIEALSDASCRVRQLIEHRGRLAGMIARLTGRRTRRFLEQEAVGLKQRCESTWARVVTSS